MSEVLIQDARWRIERQPGRVTDPMVVQFVKYSSARKLLDQNARWTDNGWDPQRWVPRVPIVPREILDRIEAHMKEAAYQTRMRCWSAQHLADRQEAP